MKKILLALIISLTLSLQASAEEVTIRLNVPEGQTQNLLDWFVLAVPIPDENEDGIPDYSKAAWVKEVIRQSLVLYVRKGKRIEDVNNANIANLGSNFIT